MLIYIALFAIVGFFIFQISRGVNTGFYELGRTELTSRDAFDVMQMPIKSLKTKKEKALLHFVLQRPWRETSIWFESFLEAKSQAECGEMDEETAKYSLSMYKSMVGSAPLELWSKLSKIPTEVRLTSPSEYSKWGSANLKMLRLDKNSRIGDLVAESSKAAALACTSTP